MIPDAGAYQDRPIGLKGPLIYPTWNYRAYLAVLVRHLETGPLKQVEQLRVWEDQRLGDMVRLVQGLRILLRCVYLENVHSSLAKIRETS